MKLTPTPRFPFEISPFLKMHTYSEYVSITDLVSGLNIDFTLDGAKVVRSFKERCPSYGLAELLFRVVRGKSAQSEQWVPVQDKCANLDFTSLRIAPTYLLSEYLINNERWHTLGNREFAKSLVNPPLSERDDSSTAEYLIPQEPFVLYHAWRPGMLPLNCDLATEILECTHRSEAAMSIVNLLKQAGWLDEEPVNIEMLVERTQTAFIAIQNPHELRLFLQFVATRAPKIIVEIGTARGGLLYASTQAASFDALIISIDLPGSSYGGGQTANERQLFKTFAKPTQTIEFIIGNSHNRETRDNLISILGGRMIDVLIIDGDHSYSGVHSDFAMYKSLVASGGWIALHDIRLFPDEWGPGNEVGVMWQEIKDHYKHWEIIDPNGVCAKTPGANTRCWGFGIIEVS